MGWWKVQGTSNVIGDEPLDYLGEAAQKVANIYREKWRRRPTRAEWEALLHAVLGSEEDANRFTEDGIVGSVRIEPKV